MWAERCKKAHTRDDQALFGIVQGGLYPHLRAESVERTVEVGFPGYGIGGYSVGEPHDAMLEGLAPVCAALPADKPRYLMGVGNPTTLLEAVARGRGHVRLRAADAHGTHGHRVLIDGAHEPEERPLCQGSRALGRDVRVPHVQHVLKGLPETPRQSPRRCLHRPCSRCTTWPSSSTSWQRAQAAIDDRYFRGVSRPAWMDGPGADDLLVRLSGRSRVL